MRCSAAPTVRQETNWNSTAMTIALTARRRRRRRFMQRARGSAAHRHAGVLVGEQADAPDDQRAEQAEHGALGEVVAEAVVDELEQPERREPGAERQEEAQRVE